MLNRPAALLIFAACYCALVIQSCQGVLRVRASPFSAPKNGPAVRGGALEVLGGKYELCRCCAGQENAGTSDCPVTGGSGSVERGGQKHLLCKKALLHSRSPGSGRGQSGT